ncbi:uncharacterized protein LOC106154544 [Lingula anatina]|uniref:protein acetyllysine N-acetyltransferase n=1 Tax=Lingula anatina TaxID=7574 RepID=A0A1S3HH66_LINAN|nr:uncharacterized protein LOC106154544 [Lingula anatina]|eukprot:XP_013384374.1 uncharacterized protein LOC106154544 [Lingula anatina]
MAEEVRLGRTSARNAKKYEEKKRIRVKEELQARAKQIAEILKKDESVRTPEEDEVLQQSPDVVADVERRAKHRNKVKERLMEIEDSTEELESKCDKLAEAIRQAKHLVIYTGAGISTAASIPDYRGPNGVWTLLQQGKEIKPQDLSDADPTITHMSIAQLYEEGFVKYVVSQNCDGLHLRSGLPRDALSEVHGNMYIEACSSCVANREYIRLFDVTEKTAVRKHKTGRFCHTCGNALKDTIVHFGEKGGLNSPYNWQLAVDQVEECDMVLCLGTSLKVLRKYPCLWNMHKSPGKRPKLCIVNLQWTPKDDMATIKINGKCDKVMHLVMEKLGISIPVYQRENDPIFHMATKLKLEEVETTSKKILPVPVGLRSKDFSLRKIRSRLERGEQDKISSSEQAKNSSQFVKTEAWRNPTSPIKWDKENSKNDCVTLEDNGSNCDVLRNMLKQPPKFLNSVLHNCIPDLDCGHTSLNKHVLSASERQLHMSPFSWHLAQSAVHCKGIRSTNAAEAIMQDHQYSAKSSKMPHLAGMLKTKFFPMQTFYDKANIFQVKRSHGSGVTKDPGYDLGFNQTQNKNFQGFHSNLIISTETKDFSKSPVDLFSRPLSAAYSSEPQQQCTKRGTKSESGFSSSAATSGSSSAPAAALAAPNFMLATANSYLFSSNLYATKSGNETVKSTSPKFLHPQHEVNQGKVSQPSSSPHVFNSNTSSSSSSFYKVQYGFSVENHNIRGEPQLLPLDLSKSASVQTVLPKQVNNVFSQESGIGSFNQNADTQSQDEEDASLITDSPEKVEVSSLKRPISVTTPGWFGKGLNVRKVKKRRLT